MGITTTPQWIWSTPPSGVATVIGYPPASTAISMPTKSGVMPQDLQNFIGVPLVWQGNPGKSIPDTTVIQWIRWAEDWIEKETGLLLCPTWVAAPAETQPGAVQAMNLNVRGSDGLQQQLGYDFDLAEAAYDFMFDRALEEGWLVLSLRYRPLRSIQYTLTDFSPMKSYGFIYPLLNEYFSPPINWVTVDEDKAMIRLVPSTDIQMLPLFALQIAIEGFAQSVPGGIHLQYTAGLTRNDYNSRYSFVPQLVLAQAGITALNVIQGTLNRGMTSTNLAMDGLQYATSYNNAGPYDGLIRHFTAMRDTLMLTARTKISGPFLTSL